MRWERFFEDLEAEADGVVGAERHAEVADRASREVGRQHLTDRLRVATGREIVIRVTAAGLVRGAIAATGNGWVRLEEMPGGQVLVPLRHVLAISGLGQKADVPGAEGKVGARLGLGYALRELARDRERVVVTLADAGAFTGVIARVGSDFVDIAEARGPGEPTGVRALTAVPFDAIALVRRAPV